MMRFLAGCLICLALGCGGSESGSDLNADKPKPTDALKATLSSIAETGEVGSAEIELTDAVERIREADPALADELLEKLQPVYRGSPAQAKKAAQKIVEEL